MYNISLDFFEPFVQGIIEELKVTTDDVVAIEGIEWTLSLTATIMINTINEGSNPLLSAVVANDPKMIRKALQPVARSKRAEVCL